MSEGGGPKFVSPIAKARAAAKAKKGQGDGGSSKASGSDETVFKVAEAAADTTTEAVDERPTILILGGCGMVGRNLVRFLATNQLCSKIRVADKTIPQIAFFHPSDEEIFDRNVEFVQADLNKPPHIERAFKNTMRIDYVVNLAAETRYGQPDEVYTERCTNLSKVCAAKAAEVGVKKFIEVSTAQVYKSQNRKAADESAAIAPFTKVAVALLNAENEVLRVPNLHTVILRPAYIYGPSDVNAIMPRIVCAAAYVELNEKMKFLWDASMKINTVHVEDVCRSIWHLLILDPSASPSGSIYNLADKSDTDQGKVNLILEQIFKIKTGFHGPIVSNLARLSFDSAVETANEKHMRPWTDLCKRANVDSTPLSPFMASEVLMNNHLFIDGTKIERDTGFNYSVPTMSTDRVKECVERAIEANLFPAISLS